MRPAPGQAAGFTLIEVLLALLIAAMVMLGTYSVTSQVMGLSEDVQSGLAAEDALEILHLTLGNDLESTIWTETQKKDAAEAMAFYGGQDLTSLSSSDDKLVFSLTTAATMDPGAPFPSHAFNRVEYVLRPLPESEKGKLDSRRLVRREIPLATLSWRDRERMAAYETVLLNEVTQFTVQFYENAANAPLSAWDSRSRQAGRLSPLPVQVRLTGTAAFSDKRRALDVRIPLPPQTLSFGDRQ